MRDLFADVCCANIPAKDLGVLADMRGVAGVVVRVEEERVWVRWEVKDARVLRRVLPAADVRLFAWREGRWFRPGKSLPEFAGPPTGEYTPLHQVLLPAAVLPLAAPEITPNAVILSLVPDDRPRPATAMIVSTAALFAWAETAPSSRLAQLRCACRDGEVLVLSQRLPAVAGALRLWGRTILKPLGYRLEPDLTERTVQVALDLADGSFLIVSNAGVEEVPDEVLRPLDRAGLRSLLQNKDRQFHP